MAETQCFEIYFLFANFRSKLNITKIIAEVQSIELATDLQCIFSKILDNVSAFKQCINMHYLKHNNMSVTKVKNIIRKQIIPKEVFGSNYNWRKFMQILEKVCTASVHENIPIDFLVHNWRIADIKWLTLANNPSKMLKKVVICLLDLIKFGILGQLFFIQQDRKTYEGHLFPLNKYQQLYDKAIADMVKKSQLIPVQNNVSNCTTVLRILPRNNMQSFRPIVRTQLLKDINRFEVNIMLDAFPGHFEKNVYKAWMQCLKNSGNGSLYAIKIDLQDAFSNVDIQKLNNSINKLSRNRYLKNSIFSVNDGPVIRCHKNKQYYWHRGLMQGMVFAAKLCELDRRFFDNTYLISLIKNAAFFHRTVDDYLYCSTNKHDILRFQAILEKHCLISKNKTETNIDNANTRITYAGRIFNMATKEIEIKIDPVETYRYKSKLYYSAPFDSIENLRRICDFAYNCFNFNKVLINGTFNSKEVVLQNYFKGMITVAFKLLCAIKERFRFAPVEFEKIILKIISNYVNRCYLLITKTAKQNGKPYYIPKKVFKVIGIRAFILVLKKRYTLHVDVINYLKKYVGDMRYWHVTLKGRFFKMPPEFNSVCIARVSRKYK